MLTKTERDLLSTAYVSTSDWPEPAEVEAIAESLRTNRSSSNVRALSERYDVDGSFVEQIAEHVANGTFTFTESLIFESAPQPKGNAMPKSFRDLTSSEIREMERAIQRVGTGPTQIAGMARRFHISESDMSIMAKAITNVASKPTTAITESGRSSAAAVPPPGVSHAVYEAAVEYDAALAGAVETPDLTGLSVGDMQSLAGAVYGPLAFRD